ncbi:MAG: glycerol kinase GlpK [Clostridia bacterium]|nr:glycerol kinase GlpK [Clostridia bacterium]MBR3808887.1 glycerol kinase GlpK [Clostridia bacterium]
MKKYILALDQGTTSSRTIVFDKKGNIVSKAQFEFTQIYPKSGWVEHDPYEIWESQLHSLQVALQNGNINPEEIAAVGITNQRETTICWERDTGKPVYNAIVWQCRRTAPICEKLKEMGLEPYVKEHTGLLIDAYFSATKIKWILDNVPEARTLANENKLCFGTVETWLIWNLTNKQVHVTDYSNASRTMLFDIEKLQWDETLCNKLGIPMSMLPEVKESSAIYGEIADNLPGLSELKGIPIGGAIGDQQSALFGQACFNAGQAKNTYGTGCFLLMNTGNKRIHSKNQLIEGIAWGLNGKVTYDLEGSAFNAGSVIKWLRDELRMISEPSECDFLAESVEDSNGIYLVPAFTGLGAPYWDMYARGCIVGLTRGTNRAHFARAVLESITYQVTDLIDAMSKDSEILISEIRVDGGASVSNVMLQIQADMSGAKVNRPKLVETTALGAAYMAGLAVGFWSSLEEIETDREVDRIFIPNVNTDKREKMLKGWHKAVKCSMNWEEA